MPGGVDPRVVILDIDEKSLNAEGRWPWSRNKLALMVNQLFDRYNVRVLAFDVAFPEPDTSSGYAVLERHAPGAIRRYRSDTELRYLVGTGVSAAAIWRMREALDAAGYPRVRIVASSGFGVDKCRVMADAKAPIDVVGTGSFIPDAWHETYATADIVEYDGVPMVKVGREFLL